VISDQTNVAVMAKYQQHSKKTHSLRGTKIKRFLVLQNFREKRKEHSALQSIQT